jgi:hypothetical protein
MTSMAMHVHLVFKGSDGQGNQAQERRHRTDLLITILVIQTLPRAANIRQYIIIMSLQYPTVVPFRVVAKSRETANVH